MLEQEYDAFQQETQSDRGMEDEVKESVPEMMPV
jgi:hypothetical protein